MFLLHFRLEVETMEDQVAKLSLNDEEEEELPIHGDHTAPKGLKLCLIGRFLIDKNVNFVAMKHRLADLWRSTIKDINHSLYLFRFFHIVDLQRVLDSGPWSFDGHLLILHHLQPAENPTSIPL